LNNIVKNLHKLWSPEGWIHEYGGADIGYLTLSLHYLSDVSKTYLNEKDEWIDEIINFISHFFHLDGSVGSVYGSRGSSVIYPSGLFNAGYKEIDEFLMSSINDKKIPLPMDLDDTNFAPFINSLIRSYLIYGNVAPRNITLPIHQDKYLKIFNEAGLVIVKNGNKQTILDLNKCGLEAVFTNLSSKRGSLPAVSSPKRGDIFCALNSSFEVSEDTQITNISIASKFYKINTKPISSLSIVGSRLLMPVFILFPRILKYLKKFIVFKYFIPGKSLGEYSKIIKIQDFTVTSEQVYETPKNYGIIKDYKYHPIRMASQNYI
jgi:hypothetical protein